MKSKFWVIAGETYRQNTRSAGFIIMCILPFLLLGGSYLIGKFMANDSDQVNIAIISQNKEVSTFFKGQKQKDYQIVSKIKTQKAAKKALADKKIDGYLVVEEKDQKLNGTLCVAEENIVSKTLMMNQLTKLNTIKTAQRLHLSVQDLKELNTPTHLKTNIINYDQDGKVKNKHNDYMMIGALIFSFIIFFVIVNYCTIIGQEIASEKGTRIMEIILSSTKATTHFYGKLVGILLVCLTQLLLYFAAGVIGYLFFKQQDFAQAMFKEISVHDLVRSLLGYNLFFFIFGLLGYVALSALLGSLVNKTENLAKVVQPVVFLAVIGFYIGMFLGQTQPNHIIVKIGSYIPLLSSFIMPFRIASNSASNLEILISSVCLVVTSIGLILFSASLYKTNVLIYNNNGWFQSLKQSLVLRRSEQKK